MQRRTTRKGDMKAPKTVRGNQARLDRNVQNEIGRNLRAMYNDVVEQGVPDRFAELVAKLDPSSTPSKPTRKE
jgi:hypothetical protein